MRYILTDRHGRIIANCGTCAIAVSIALSTGLEPGWKVE